MIGLEDRQSLAYDIHTAHKAGARLRLCCLVAEGHDVGRVFTKILNGVVMMKLYCGAECPPRPARSGIKWSDSRASPVFGDMPPALCAASVLTHC